MNGICSNFCEFWHNETIPGHEFVKPAIWLEKTIYSIFSDLNVSGYALVLEVVKRFFLSLCVILAFIPCALFATLVGLPSKVIGYKLFYEEPLEEGIVAKSACAVKEISPNGNCAFEGFLRMMRSEGYKLDVKDSVDFRIKSAHWIRDNIDKDPELQKLAFESIEEYLEVKLNWLKLTEEQVRIDPPQEGVDKTLERLAAEKTLVQEKKKQIQEAKELKPVMAIVSEYLDAIQSDRDTERVYASRAHYYAFSRMFDVKVNIEIYTEREKDYNLISKVRPPQETPITIRFLHNGENHIDLLTFS